MTKLMLYPNFASYILSLTAMQSQDTFLKMESIAKQQIESFAGLTDIFIGEVVSAANHDGFIHHPQGFRCKLYNGSFVQTVSGDSDNSRGKILPGYIEIYSCNRERNWKAEMLIRVEGLF